MKTKNYLSTNDKLKKSGILSWGIPAAKSADGTLICIGAKDCLTGCYARQGRYVMPNVRKAQEERLELSRGELFVDVMDAEIKRRKPFAIRIHDSGDFYSLTYLRKWTEIMRRNPSVRFYAYTKAVAMFKAHVCPTMPANFQVIFSMGGKWDNMIDVETDRHSMVFESVESLEAAGYADAHIVDTPAFQASTNKIGLVYHGFNSRKWTTEAVRA